MVLDYFLKYQNDPLKIHEEWKMLQSDYEYRDLSKFPFQEYCLKMCYLCDYNPGLQFYVLQKMPTSDFDYFWSYIWSQNISKFILLKNSATKESSSNTSNYWPDEGSILYKDFEISTLSIHMSPWYVTRNFFLKNILTDETKTVTQFNFIKWPTNRDDYLKKKNSFIYYLLQFRREFQASFSEKSSPLLIQSEDDANANGCFTVLDSILNRLMNGVREIDIQANLEFFRDQCPNMISDFLNYEIIFDAVSTDILQICNGDET